MVKEYNINFESREILSIEKFRKSNHTAILTILFTDIVGYTKFSEDVGEVVSSRFRRLHDELFLKVISQDDSGKIIKQIGDSFLAIFAEPSTAVIKAIEFQKLLSENSTELTHNNYVLKVRIGIHLGQVSLEDSIQPDIFGRHVNRASRIMSIAEGNQVLTSYPVWDNASGWLKEKEYGIESTSIGNLSFKGIAIKSEIFEFYSRETGPIGVPNLVRKDRLKKRTLKFGILGLSLILLFFIIYLTGFARKIFSNKTYNSLQPTQKIYISDIISNNETKVGFQSLFQQFSLTKFDTIKYKIEALSDSLIDELSDEIVTYSISLYYPDIVVSESEKEIEFFTKGKTLPKIDSDSLFINNTFLSKIGCQKGIFPIIYSTIPPFNKNNYVVIVNYASDATNCFSVFSTNRDSLIIKINEFIESNRLNEKKVHEPKGEVLSNQNNKLLIKFYSNDHNFQKGTSFYLAREYKPFNKPSDNAVKERIKDLELLKDFYESEENWKESIPYDSTQSSYYWSFQEYSDLKSDSIKYKWICGVGLGIELKITEVYDSTATAIVTKEGEPWIKIKPGDKIWMK